MAVRFIHRLSAALSEPSLCNSVSSPPPSNSGSGAHGLQGGKYPARLLHFFRGPICPWVGRNRSFSPHFRGRRCAM